MSKVKYDGWCIKYCWTKRLFPPVSRDRSFLISDYEQGTKGLWRNHRRKGIVKMVRVRIVEVSDGQ